MKTKLRSNIELSIDCVILNCGTVYSRDLNLDKRKYVHGIKLTRIIPKDHKIPYLSCTGQKVCQVPIESL